MPTQLERFELIVQDETRNCSQNVQQQALQMLRTWIDAPEEQRGQLCQALRQQIKTALSKQERRPARIALKRISERIASEAIEDAHAEARNRRSASLMKRETLAGYELIRRHGKGFVFFGTSRSESSETEYVRARELAREISLLFSVTTYCGAGPGDMDAVARGAQEAGGRIAGVKIHLTAEQSRYEQNVSAAFEEGEYVECEFFAPRKVLLTDATMRDREEDRTGVICLPGGYGTMDEFFEFDNLKLLKKLGTQHAIPVILMNYNGEYDGILAFIERAISDGRIDADEGYFRPSDPERKGIFCVCTSNAEVLDYLADFYGVPDDKRVYAQHLRNWEVDPEKIPEGTGQQNHSQNYAESS